MQEIYTKSQTSSMIEFIRENLKYWLLEHPSIVSFRWSPTQSWGSTWWFLISAIFFYIATAVTIHVILKLCRWKRPVPLGLLPAIHSLSMSLISVTIFIGMFFSAEAEVRDTRWLWQRTRTTPFEWLLCFPLGNFHMVLFGCNLACHVGVLMLHYSRGGCNGIGAWVFNSMLNVLILLHFLKSYVDTQWQKKDVMGTSSSKREDGTVQPIKS
ncbi:fatty acid elongase 3-like [Cicer arietinum]|uniref:Elongation of fatty acids protein 3-like n=1 Tax=Cicer arietinum TaxID=3827 RepID=A0A3Q7YB57_CICAR|nr:elongation of fatty acids protein 3-like [Cicer arietinum]